MLIKALEKNLRVSVSYSEMVVRPLLRIVLRKSGL